MRKLLAVRLDPANYGRQYQVTVVRSFREARELIVQAEREGYPFDALDLPVTDRERFWEFLMWMRNTGRDYPFSVYGCDNADHFWLLCKECRAMGFHFNT